MGWWEDAGHDGDNNKRRDVWVGGGGDSGGGGKEKASGCPFAIPKVVVAIFDAVSLALYLRINYRR